jgi:hypothetical protein
VIAGTLAYMAPEQTGRMNRSVDSVEQAYRRSARINKRREMMLAWSKFALGNCA